MVRAVKMQEREQLIGGQKILGWETGIEPATVGATVRCSAS